MRTVSRQKRVRPEDIAPPFGFVQKLGIATLLVAFVAVVICTGREYQRMRRIRFGGGEEVLAPADVKVAAQLPFPLGKWARLKDALIDCEKLSHHRIVVSFPGAASAQPTVRKEGRIVIKRKSVAGDKFVAVRELTFRTDEPLADVADRVWTQLSGFVALYVQERNYEKIRNRFRSLIRPGGVLPSR